jgi:maleate isomerase
MRLEEKAVADELEKMNEDIERCGDLLATADVDVLVYGVTAGSYLKGEGYDTQIESNLEDRTGIPAVATAASMRRALDALDVSSLVLATPYVQELNHLEEEFLAEHGFEVLDDAAREIEAGVELGVPTPQSVYRQAKAVDRPDADAVFISGMNYRTSEVIEPLEADLGKPVLSSNQVSMWDALRTAGVNHTELEFGTLFDEP